MKSTPTQDQHFVPRFYLKNFANVSGRLEVLNIRGKRMAKHLPYQALGYEYYFYALLTGVPDELSQEIEAGLKEVEDFVSKRIKKIIEVILSNKQIRDMDRYTLSVFMGMLYLRSPGMRNQLLGMENDMIDQMKVRFNLGSFQSTNNFAHLKLMVDSGFGGPGFANLFNAMKWKIYITRAKETFITSDTPVVEKSPFLGASFLDREFFFPLTPQIFIELRPQKGSSKINRKTLYENDDEKVKMLNIIAISGAQEFAYSGNRSSLEWLLLERKNLGRLSKEYKEKYET